ncbi:MAG TPA: hypothetical protein IGS40_06950 [Trichormus sp. M33_DOE_039]|nr:hypothetical protein [Trichormus sp. M33_DOE_039]
MNPNVSDRLYNLLPAIYRIRDSEPSQGQALRALMALIEAQLLDIEADIDQLYDNEFIETCEDWVVPYIGDLLGVRHLQNLDPNTYSQRAYVANTLAYRQRKGTATVLEQLARDVTQWTARVVEFFERLSTTQYLNHLRLQNHRTPDLRDTNALELIATPLETANYSGEVRRINSRRGYYNIPNIGIFLWRLQAYPLERVTAKAVIDNSTGLYWMNPLGQDIPLFNRPRPELEISRLAAEINLPTSLRRRSLFDEVEALASNQPSATDYFSNPPVLRVFLDGVEIPPEQLSICNLSGLPVAPGSNWVRPNVFRSVAVDPVLGRLAIPNGADLPTEVLVSYAYGFSGDLGGGAYNRRDAINRALPRPINWQVGVSREYTSVGNEEIFTTLGAAITAWHSQVDAWEATLTAWQISHPGETLPASFIPPTGAIALMDNQTYTTDQTPITPIRIPSGAALMIVAANWAEVEVPNLVGVRERRIGQLTPNQRRSHLQGDWYILGTASSENPGQLTLDGLLIEGRVTVQPGNLGKLRVSHATLLPQNGGLTVQPSTAEGKTNNRLVVELDHSITGAVYLPPTVAALQIADSILDATEAGNILISEPVDFPLPAGELEVSLSSGETFTLTLNAANDIDAARSILETALQIAPINAQVGKFEQRLIIISQAETRHISFAATATDAMTVKTWGLDTAASAIASPSPDQAAPPTRIERSTILGSSYVQAFDLGSEVIFTAAAIAQRRQIGCLRFSYVPPTSRTPRRYRCQPELETSIQQELREKKLGRSLTPTEQTDIQQRIQQQLIPSFTSTRYGEPAYGQLSLTCPVQIRTGAADGSEMGAFSFLKQPQREANLRIALDEYLRFGLAAGIFYVT